MIDLYYWTTSNGHKVTILKGLARSPFDVTIIDRHNYHLFQPLLYQVATAGLSPADIASPIRSILRNQKNTRVILANVSSPLRWSSPRSATTIRITARNILGYFEAASLCRHTSRCEADL